MTFKTVEERYCPFCGSKLIPPKGQNHWWECPIKDKTICPWIDGTFDDRSDRPLRQRLAAIPR